MRKNSFYVIADPCIGVKDKSCVAVCPVDCIQGGDSDTQLFINPDECICCGLCQPECPVDAIFTDDEVPEKWLDSIARNAAFFQR
ncbi:ferredoxin family protein [Armatimonas sp.]|uniref:4Fe-4S dicluster domain-containing protein n=1 Tax=Armatimonas sp. TaxID=1872638 RepID=UPI00374CDBF7